MENQLMRKRNTKLFPFYKALAWDYLFYYTIDFLFLTIVKDLNASDVVLKNTFYAFFCILMQIPANVIIEFLGRKNSMILGNVFNCVYLVIIMLSSSLGDLILAEFISSIAFSIKTIAEPSILNESIVPSKNKSKIYSKITAKGATGYYTLNALSKITAGFLFGVNYYLPMICSLVVCGIVVLLSLLFIEPIPRKKKSKKEALYQKQLKDIKEGFVFVFKSERLKALILCSALISSLLSILNNYYVSLFEDLAMNSATIGIIAAIGSVIAAGSSKMEKQIQNRFKNKTLITTAIIVSISTIIAGLLGLIGYKLIIIISLMFLIFNFGCGAYYTLIEKYLSNFSNEKIDAKIFATNNLFVASAKVISGLLAAFLLDKFITAYCMIIIGAIYTIIYLLTKIYMSNRVGLKPEEYSKEELKFDAHHIEK